MAVNGVTNTGSATGYASQSRGVAGMSQTEFLKILVAELQNQNPLNPADNTDFVTQMIQFQLLEQMNLLSQSYKTSQAMALLGKNVVAQLIDDTTGAVTYIEGEVTGVLMNGGEPLLQVGDYMVSVDSVVAATDVLPAGDGTGDENDGTGDENDGTDDTQTGDQAG